MSLTKHKAMIGKRFSRLTIVRYAGTGNSGHRMYLCKCDCGREKILRSNHLRRIDNPTRSCGCLATEANTIHGHTTWANGKQKRTKTYRTWDGMIQRCTNNKCNRWVDYGAKGVAVCERWKTFENFLADMGERPEGMTIDRVNPYGNYELSNCRWADKRTQANNKRNTYKQAA